MIDVHVATPWHFICNGSSAHSDDEISCHLSGLTDGVRIVQPATRPDEAQPAELANLCPERAGCGNNDHMPSQIATSLLRCSVAAVDLYPDFADPWPLSPSSIVPAWHDWRRDEKQTVIPG